MNKRWIKEVRALQLKKNRKKEGLFIVEGRKNVLELMGSFFQVEALFYTEKYASEFETHPKFGSIPVKDISTETALTQAGTLKQNDSALAVAKIPADKAFSIQNNECVLALDDVRDPGNLGTIIRIADWYGIKKIFCSETTADFFNPKVITSSMGSFTRIKVIYGNLPQFLEDNKHIPNYGALMNGKNIHQTEIPKPAIIVMGNESNGITEQTIEKIQTPITIPRFGGAESLNVAIATAVICDNIFRK